MIPKILGIAAAWPRNDAGGALAFAAECATTQERRGFFAELGGNWAGADGDMATATAGRLPAGADRDAFLQGMVEALARQPAAAAGWIARLPAGAGRDAATKALVEVTQSEAPELAAPLVTQIADPDMRAGAIEQLGRHWLAANRSAATAWLAQAGLPPDRLDRLLAAAGAGASNDDEVIVLNPFCEFN